LPPRVRRRRKWRPDVSLSQNSPPRFKTTTAPTMNASAAKRRCRVLELVAFHSPASMPKRLAERMLEAMNSMKPIDVP